MLHPYVWSGRGLALAGGAGWPSGRGLAERAQLTEGAGLTEGGGRGGSGRMGRVELFVSWHDWSRAEPELCQVLPAETAAAVSAAVRFATAWHGDQRRPTGAPYLDHLLEALEVLVRGAGVTDPDVLCAAVLHDVVEDTPCPLAEIRAAFGPKVAEFVGWVTIPEPGPGEAKSDVKRAYLERLPHAPAQARLVKLADRASNVQTLRNLAPDRQRRYFAQTVTYIVPLAAMDPWFARWYAAWQRDFADLG
jgi:guanosine-3',5'-bis(diphosphate) 3'-pyrophosphohydrolase